MRPPRRIRVGTPRSLRHGAAVGYPTRRWASMGFVVGLVAAVGVVGWLLYLASAAPTSTKTVGSTLEATLAKPAVAVTVGVLVFLLGGWCLRNLRFEWLARSPGHIEVADFKPLEGEPRVDVAWLTSAFRARVTQLSLQAPAPVPGAAAEGAYLDVLSQAALDARNPLTLVRLGRALWPTHAYRVEATLRADRSRAERQYSMLVQVSRLPSAGSTLVEAAGASWEEVIRRAADEATGLILPRTRLCRHQWLSWRGYVMPIGLLHAFERAVELEARGDSERRRGLEEEAEGSYRDALLRYERALAKDPFNLAIRLRIGQLLERIGRPLEALAAYQAIVTVTLPAGERLPRSLYRRRMRRERSRIITIARYRRAVILGRGELVVPWLRAPAVDTSDTSESLKRLIADEISQHAGMLVWEPERLGWGPEKRRLCAPTFGSGKTLAELADELAPVTPGTWQEQARLRAVLAALGYAMMRELQHDRRLRIRLLADRLRQFLPRTGLPAAPPFTLKALLLAQVCIQLRLTRALAELAFPDCDWEREARAAVDRVWQLMGGRVSQWHEGYNAACACGIPLDYADPPDAERLAREAVDWLERATACADSSFVAGENEWLKVDPDLRGVMGDDAYRVWRSVYFPSSDDGARAIDAPRR